MPTYLEEIKNRTLGRMQTVCFTNLNIQSIPSMTKVFSAVYGSLDWHFKLIENISLILEHSYYPMSMV